MLLPWKLICLNGKEARPNIKNFQLFPRCSSLANVSRLSRHFTIRGADDTDFAGGVYHGRIMVSVEMKLCFWVYQVNFGTHRGLSRSCHPNIHSNLHILSSWRLPVALKPTRKFVCRSLPITRNSGNQRKQSPQNLVDEHFSFLTSLISVT